ncbi:MAG: helix-turn-helix domain-containing protein [Planctomycetaceae bacterium]|nr:helix-turn-helix domain-containing protein [Planctomycetaceae bacterium]
MPTIGFETSVAISGEEREIARISSEKLAKFRNKALRVQLGGKGECSIPASAIPLLAEMLSVMAEGQAVTVVPVQTELTTQQAAEVLGVSRPFLIKLLDGGEIPHRLVGTHRRVLLNDVLEYRRQTDRNRETTLEKLAAEAQKLNLGY